MLEGNRKFILSVLCIISFTFIVSMSNFKLDYFQLGLGLGAVAFPVMLANAIEHWSKRPAK